jgi:integrase
MLSCKTKDWREAKHVATLWDRWFQLIWSLAVSHGGEEEGQREVLRGVLQEVRQADQERAGAPTVLSKAQIAALASRYLSQRMEGDEDRCIFGSGEAAPYEAVAAQMVSHGGRRNFTPEEVAESRGMSGRDITKRAEAISILGPHYRESLARGDTTAVDDELGFFLEAEGITLDPTSESYRRLAYAALQAEVEALDVAERRHRGEVVYIRQPPPDPSSDNSGQAMALPLAEPNAPTKPHLSALVEPFFHHRASVDCATHQVMNQERATIRRFLEHCGDRPADGYGRGDVTGFIGILRQLPNTYGRSPADKDRSLGDLIARADAQSSPRLTDKTIKRHLSALSQFFRFAMDGGHITVSAWKDLVGGYKFRTEKGARKQRDAWSSNELKALFTSPVWTGCDPAQRTKTGPEMIRDAKFWLFILALFHGARLEEMADLYRRDVTCIDGTWAIAITEAGGRRLKTANAERVIPLHPELERLGFLDYVAATAPNPGDPLFPDIAPQGKDHKRGARITRWFVEYRKAVGVYKEGMAMHAFRHTARTRLEDVATTVQQGRHIDFLFGQSSGGGEGRVRYDKGPGLKALAETLAMLRYPELDFSPLYPANSAKLPDAEEAA